MRVIDDRYRKDLRRLHLAWHMMRLGARTTTISRWTNMSVYQLRHLRTEYAADTKCLAPLKGVTPSSVLVFSKSALIRCEAPLLAGFLRHFGVVPESNNVAPEALASVARGERLCLSYEQFNSYRPKSALSFEHAVFLLQELTRQAEIELIHCSECDELVLHDLLSARKRLCPYCHADEPQADQELKRLLSTFSTSALERPRTAGPQRPLF